jgi:hypothetical protein
LVVGWRYTSGYIRVVHTHTHTHTHALQLITKSLWHGRPGLPTTPSMDVWFASTWWGEGGDPFEKSGKKDDIWGSTNSMYYYSLPKSLLSWDSTNKFQHQVQKGVVWYISRLYQTDWFYVEKTNKQTDVHGRTEWQSPTSLKVLCTLCGNLDGMLGC